MVPLIQADLSKTSLVSLSLSGGAAARGCELQLMSEQGCAMPQPAVPGQLCQPKALIYGDTVLQLVFVFVGSHVQCNCGLSL